MPSRTTYSSRRAARDFLRRIREVYKLVADAELGHAWIAGLVVAGAAAAAGVAIGANQVLAAGVGG